MLRRITLNGFKSIKAMDLELRALNVLIGGNGAGKSNLISFFRMLNEMMTGRLRQYVGTTGRARSGLHFGAKVGPEVTARLDLEADIGVDTYAMRLFHAAGDTEKTWLPALAQSIRHLLPRSSASLLELSQSQRDSLWRRGG